MNTFLRSLIAYLTLADYFIDGLPQAVGRVYYWCQCEQPINTGVFDDSAPGFVCGVCEGIIRGKGGQNAHD